MRIRHVVPWTLALLATAAQAVTFEQKQVTAGLDTPTAMEFAPDGRLFVSEKAGRLRVVKNGVLLAQPFVTLNVAQQSERGLLGIAFDPDFASNRFVYVYYTRSSSPIKNRVSRFTASTRNPDVARADSEVVILDDIASDAGNHNGGSIHFGPDGKLYIGVGDGGANPQNAQSLATLSGKLLRINRDGSIPADNPFVGTPGARGEIWALGLRNPYTFAIDPTNGRININDVGQSSWEEVNLGQAGANYGWPNCEGPSCAGDPKYTGPVYSYSHAEGQAITGGSFYRAGLFPPEYQGSYFFADFLGGWIRRLDRDNQKSDFWNPGNGPVDLKVAPDGSLVYLSIFEGAVYVVQPSGTNNPPVAAFSASPPRGRAPLTVRFDATASGDVDGDALGYAWDFGDGSSGSGVTPSHDYTQPGSYTVRLTVDDGKGGSSSASKTVRVR